jgi:sorbitol-specific phosphotransferase system component IIA
MLLLKEIEHKNLLFDSEDTEVRPGPIMNFHSRYQ